MDTVDQHADAAELGASMRIELGMLLRQERLKQKKEIGDVAKRLILSPSQVLNLEAGTMDSFHHERRYVHALKGYLFYLGLSRDLIINDKLQQLEAASLQAVPSSASGVARLYKAGHGPAPLDPQMQKRRIYMIAGGIAAVATIALAVTFGSVLFSSAKDPETEQVSLSDSDKSITAAQPAPPESVTTTAEQSAQAAPAPAPIASPTAVVAKSQEPVSQAVSAAPAPISGAAASSTGPSTMTANSSPDPFANLKSSTLRIVFLGECWASLITTDGRRNERIFQAGQSIDVELDRVATLTIGNSPETKLQVGSKPLDLSKSGALTGNVARLNQAILQRMVKQ